ncbi:MAG TPA: hypothetical protein VHW00_21725 [Thermoanaerobaculia bacterium]|nr:hypothetical protein [Thermoanaerobaculia bacterium]
MANEDPIDFDDLRHDEDGRMLLDGELFTGVAVERWSTGARASEIAFENGLQHGFMRSWHPNGVMSAETNYVSGNAVGQHREWDESGRLRREELISEDGVLLVLKEWDDRGQLLNSGPKPG